MDNPNTGCYNCDAVQRLTGDPAAICSRCWIEQLEWEIEQNKAKIKELTEGVERKKTKILKELKAKKELKEKEKK